MKQFVCYIIALVLLYSCDNFGKKKNFLDPDSKKKVKYAKVTVDTITLNDSGLESSLEGFTGKTKENKIYFLDKRFCWFYIFDTNGKLISRTFGQGGGPDETEIGRIEVACLLPNYDLFMLGPSLDHHIYDGRFKEKKQFMLLPGPRKPPLSEISKITHDYFNLACRYYDGNVYLNVHPEHPDFNYIQHTKQCLEDSYHILEVDLEKGKYGKLYMKGYPDVYKTNSSKYAAFSFINFDIDSKGNFYVGYDVDSLVRKYDKQFLPLIAFGFSGKNMDTDYSPINSLKEARKGFKERGEKGYYGWVEHIDETGLLFRSYKKGLSSLKDGLQIYSKNALIADVEVPKNLKVAFYISPYYYSQAVVNEEKEKLEVYRFKLN